MNDSIPYCGNIEKLTLQNTDFRQVIYTAPHCQLVLMAIKPHDEIGAEVHAKNDQFFRFESGVGQAVVNGKKYDLADGMALLVPAGAEHNIINTGDEYLKLYTVYSPAHHIDGRIHVTRQDAEADDEDEKFGDR